MKKIFALVALFAALSLAACCGGQKKAQNAEEGACCADCDKVECVEGQCAEAECAGECAGECCGEKAECNKECCGEKAECCGDCKCEAEAPAEAPAECCGDCK